MHWKADLEINSKKSTLAQAIICYFTSPSFKAVTRYRVYRWLYKQGPFGRILHKPLFVQNCNMGVYISPLAEIGTALYLPHPVGVVIGEGAFIGDKVTLFQGVTIGVSKEGSTRYPRIENEVTVYANAVLVGGITIGSNAKVAALSFVNQDVPPGMLAVGIPACIRELKNRPEVPIRDA